MDERLPCVAGMFYPSGKGELEKMLNEMFSGVKEGKKYDMVVSPHAGYMYSGKTAAFAVSSLKDRRRFIILGPNHNAVGSKFAIPKTKKWKIPTGTCEVDEEVREFLLEKNIVEESEEAHKYEHSIEVQLPFLKHRFKNFTFVPVSIINITYDDLFLDDCKKLGEALASAMKKFDCSVVASSDFTHYMPLDLAKKMDAKAIERIKALDGRGFFRVLHETGGSICGYGGIASLIFAAGRLGMKTVDVIHSSSSGDASGDYGSVVTYHAIGFV